MIDNIGKSFIGGFFRRLGSIFAFIFILIILGYLLKDSKIDFSEIFGISKVNASTYERNDYYPNAYTDNTFSDSYGKTWNMFYLNNISSTTSTNITYNYTPFYFNESFEYNTSGELHIPYQLVLPTVSTNTTSTIYANEYCTRYNWGSLDSNNQVLRWDCDRVGSGNNSDIIDKEYLPSHVYIKAIVRYQRQNSSTPCDVEDNYLVCPIPKNSGKISYVGIYSYVRYSTTNTYNYSVGLSQIFNVFTDSSSQILQEQQQTNNKLDETNNQLQESNELQQETNNKIDDVKDTITDNTLNNNDIENELGSLSIDNPSLGFFTTFLTLPLTWVQNILASSNTCRDLVVPLPYTNTTLTLPCMTQFWQNLGVLGTLIQAVWLAIVGVRIFNGLFLLTVDSISSKDNVDELTKIRSWEL